MLSIDPLTQGAVTRPNLLVELHFAPVLRFTTGNAVVWNGYNWREAPVELTTIKIAVTGDVSASLKLGNLGREFGVLILNQGTAGRRCRIWSFFSDPVASPPRLIFDGYMDASKFNESVTISLVGRSAYYGQTPHVVCVPPLFNHLPKPGSELVWGSTRILLSPR